MHKKDGVFAIVVPFTSGVVLCFGDCVPGDRYRRERRESGFAVVCEV